MRSLRWRAHRNGDRSPPGLGVAIAKCLPAMRDIRAKLDLLRNGQVLLAF